MENILFSISIFLLLASGIGLLVGFIMALASKEKKQLGIKILIYSVIAFVIGFGTCVAGLSI